MGMLAASAILRGQAASAIRRELPRQPPDHLRLRDGHAAPHLDREHQLGDHEILGNISKILQIFGGLVLGCIRTKLCKKICVRQHFSRSTRFAFMRLWEKRTEIENEVMKMYTD